MIIIIYSSKEKLFYLMLLYSIEDILVTDSQPVFYFTPIAGPPGLRWRWQKPEPTEEDAISLH